MPRGTFKGRIPKLHFRQIQAIPPREMAQLHAFAIEDLRMLALLNSLSICSFSEAEFMASSFDFGGCAYAASSIGESVRLVSA